MSADAGRADAIREFWSWWEATGEELAGRVVAGHSDPDAEAELSRLVAAIDPGLQWEFGPGSQSLHLLVVTAAGDPSLRAPARAWLAAAPPSGTIWGFADLRAPVPNAADSILEFAGRTIALDDFVVAAQRGSTSIDVAIHHPVFNDIGEDEAAHLSYLALDTFLGEEATETWIGAVTWPSDPPLDAFPLRHLATIVADFAAGHRDPSGAPAWVGLQGTGPTGLPILAFAQIPLRQITFPLFDTHVAVSLPYAEAGPDGQPTTAGEEHLQAVAERIGAALGADGRTVAQQSHDGIRLLHVYVDGRTDAGERIAAAAADWEHGNAQTVLTHDPGWSLVHHLAG